MFIYLNLFRLSFLLFITCLFLKKDITEYIFRIPYQSNKTILYLDRKKVVHVTSCF